MKTLRNLFNRLFAKGPKPHSFNEIYAALEKEAKAVNRDYFVLRISYCKYGWSFDAYVSGYDWKGNYKTPEELLEAVRIMLGTNNPTRQIEEITFQQPE